MKAPLALFVAALGAALVLVGCGGASDEPAVVDRMTIDQSPPSAVNEPVEVERAAVVLDAVEPEGSAAGLLEAPSDDARLTGE